MMKIFLSPHLLSFFLFDWSSPPLSSAFLSSFSFLLLSFFFTYFFSIVVFSISIHLSSATALFLLSHLLFFFIFVQGHPWVLSLHDCSLHLQTFFASDPSIPFFSFFLILLLLQAAYEPSPLGWSPPSLFFLASNLFFLFSFHLIFFSFLSSIFSRPPINLLPSW